MMLPKRFLLAAGFLLLGMMSSRADIVTHTFTGRIITDIRSGPVDVISKSFYGSYVFNDTISNPQNPADVPVTQWELFLPDIGVKLTGSNGVVTPPSAGNTRSIFGVNLRNGEIVDNQSGVETSVSGISFFFERNGSDFYSGQKLLPPNTSGLLTNSAFISTNGGSAPGLIAAVGTGAIDVTSVNWQADREMHYFQIEKPMDSSAYDDRYFTFIQTNGTGNTGYSAFSLNAQYLIRDRSLLRYTGNGNNWSWEKIADIEVTDIGRLVYFKVLRDLLPGNTFRYVVWGNQRSGNNVVFPQQGTAEVQLPTSGTLSNSFPVENVSWEQNAQETTLVYESDNARISLSDAANTFIDIDANPFTGYRVYNQGAEFLIRNTTLYVFAGSMQGDWVWKPVIEGAVTIASPTKVTIRFPRELVADSINSFVTLELPEAFRFIYFSDNRLIGGQGTQTFPENGAAGFHLPNNQPFNLSDISMGSADNSATVSVTITNEGPLQPDNNLFVFFEVQETSGPRYAVRQIGATHMIRGTGLFVYTGSGSNWSWNKLEDVGLLKSDSEFQLEMWFPPSLIIDQSPIQLRYLAFGDNRAAGGTGFSFAPDFPEGRTKRAFFAGSTTDFLAHIQCRDGFVRVLGDQEEQSFILFDTDNDSTTGYSAYGLGADVYLNNNTAFRYTGSGTDWSWEFVEFALAPSRFIFNRLDYYFYSAGILGDQKSIKFVNFFNNQTLGLPNDVFPNQSYQGVGGSFHCIACLGNGGEKIRVDGNDAEWIQPDIRATENDALAGYNFTTDLAFEVDQGGLFFKVTDNGENFSAHSLEFDINNDGQADLRITPITGFDSVSSSEPALQDISSGAILGFPAHAFREGQPNENSVELGIPLEWFGNLDSVGVRYLLQVSNSGDIIETYPRLNQPFLSVPLR